MTNISPSHLIYLAESTLDHAGRGVFASTDLKSGTVIEVCPVITIDHPAEYQHLKQTALRRYYYLWPKEPVASLCLGFGSLYNHSYDPNATYAKDPDEGTIIFTALRDITAHEEITTNYNYGNPHDKSPLWTADIPPAPSKDQS